MKKSIGWKNKKPKVEKKPKIQLEHMTQLIQSAAAYITVQITNMHAL